MCPDLTVENECLKSYNTSIDTIKTQTFIFVFAFWVEFGMNQKYTITFTLCVITLCVIHKT